MTPVKNVMLTTLNAFKTISLDKRPEGSISKEQTQTPMTQLMEMSADERRLTILMISGMFHNGKLTEAAKPICSTNVIR